MSDEPESPRRRKARASDALFPSANGDDAVYLKTSEVMQRYKVSRGTLDKMLSLADFPRPTSATRNGYNLRWVCAELDAWFQKGKIEPGIEGRRRAPARSAEDAVRDGLDELRKGRKKATRRFR